jgi:HlyD family secretion protein
MRFGRWPVLIGGLLLLALIGGLLFNQFRNSTAPGTLPPGWTRAEASLGSINATVSATGNVEPEAQADLRFGVTGTVQEIVVKPGDSVTAGQPLARVDAADAELNVQKARAAVAEAQADFDELRNGATAEEIAAAQADLARAQGQYSETAGSVTDADQAAAQAALEQARARLARLESGPKTTEVAGAQAALDRARAQHDQQLVALQRTRDEKSKAKTDAERRVQEATIALEREQSEYSQAYWNYQNVKDKGRQPAENEGQTNPELSDYGNLTAYEQFKQAELELADAQLKLEQAQEDFEQARADETTAIQQAEREVASAEAQVREAQADFDELLNGADPDELAEARANIADAQARLAELNGLQRSGSLAAAQASVDSAQANLDKLLADPTASELSRRQAAILRAEADLALAERELEQTTLTAPFDGTVASVAIAVGEPAEVTDQGQAAISIADLSGMHVDVPIDELDIDKIVIGQQVQLTLDALPGRLISGIVERIAPVATAEEQGTRTYEVTVAIRSAEQGVRPGMTAVVDIITEQRPKAVLLPRRAVVLDGGKSYVLRPTAGAPQPDGTPASERVEVEVGLSNNEQVEILRGVEPGDEVLVQDVVETFNPFGEQ